MEIFSFGGGIQSMAGLILAAQGQLTISTFRFANVGNNAEYPSPRYSSPVALSYARSSCGS